MQLLKIFVLGMVCENWSILWFAGGEIAEQDKIATMIKFLTLQSLD